MFVKSATCYSLYLLNKLSNSVYNMQCIKGCKGNKYMTLQKLLSKTRQVIDEYQLIDDGDHIAVGISGGKDSLTLLYVLSHLRKFYPKKFELTAITVDLGLGNQDFSTIKELCKQLDVNYHIESTQIFDIVFHERQESNPCALCAKMRKGALNNKIAEFGCNKVAYAHHKDDFIETLLLSMFYEGQFYTFAPSTFLDGSNLTIIRPLMYVLECEIIGFANKYELPIVKSTCPADGNTKREYIKTLLATLNKDNPNIKKNLFHAVVTGHINDWELLTKSVK